MAPTLIASYEVDSAASDTTTLTTPSFTPANGEVIVVKSGTADVTCTIGLASGGGQTYTQRADVSGGASLGAARITTAVISGSPGAMTVSQAFGGTAAFHSMVVERWSNAVLAATPATNNGGTKTGTNSAPSSTVTTAANGSVVSSVDVDWNATAPAGHTYRSSATEDGLHDQSPNFYVAYYFYQTAATAGAQTFGMTAPSTQNWSLLGIEIQSTPSVPYAGRQAPTASAVASAPWLQRDRRDANAAVAANPLPSPLDSAWQAGARYWHLYAAAADNTARVWQPQQRARVSDPGLLATAELENELLGSADDLARHRHAGVYTDRREVPQQRPYVSDPLLLTTAELENELLGSFDDLARHRSPAAYVDRRLVPQQRPYVSDPRLLTTGLLENELLGSVDDLARHRSAAVYTERRMAPQQRAYVSDPLLLTAALLEDALLGQADDRVRRYHAAAELADRREVPQQRAYVSAVGLLDTAELENELLGGADTGKRVLTPATHVPRWWMPQQPARRTLYFDAGPDVPPLTLAYGAGGHYALLYAQAGWQPDRREVPQQRAYISDPSFYPTTAATDPLTVAWGAGGRYWLLYNTAAEQVDRRVVPQQRRYICDPTLLATAQLEDALLGGADDLRRRVLTAAVFTDRRLVPQQRVYFDPSLLFTALLENELLGGGDTARRYLAAAYGDRRLAPQQRAYVSDPALLAGALLENELLGGATATLRYGLAASHTDRRQYPVQRAYRSDPLLLLATALLDSPLLGSVDDLTRHRAWYTDQRSVGWQPPRFDPNLLTPPPLLPADPLLLAGGVGGDLWRRYHTPAYATRARPDIRRPPPLRPPSPLTLRNLLLITLGLGDRVWMAGTEAQAPWVGTLGGAGTGWYASPLPGRVWWVNPGSPWWTIGGP